MQAVLFDLDGTLLDLNLDAFLKRYFAALRDAVSPLFPGVDVLAAVLGSTAAMQRAHEGTTNRDVFNADFLARTGSDISDGSDVFDRFYQDVFPALGAESRPAPGAREAVLAARALGMKVVVATQPIFPRAAIVHRLAWAGLSEADFDLVTTYEFMNACKPHAAYFRQVTDMLGCDPRECVMVGDDRDNDMPAAATGMRTFYVGTDPGAPADFRGTLLDLPAVLERLTANRP